MTKNEYFLAAMAHGRYKEAPWVVRLLAQFFDAPEAWRAKPVAYDLVYLHERYWFVDPAKDLTLTPLSDSPSERALFLPKERIDITPETVANAREALNTTIGNVIANYILLIYPFGGRLPFKSGRFNTADIEAMTAPLLKSDPKPGEPEDPEAIYVRDHIKFGEAAFMLTNFCLLIIPGDTARSITTDPRMGALKEELFAQYKDQLTDPTVVAKIGAALEQLDREWLKDDSSNGLFIKAKDFNVIRKKLFAMVGNETGFGTSQAVNPIKKSLSEGIDLTRFAEYVDGSRAGSFNRGAQTALGGELVKWLQRASTNIKIVAEDCGTTLGKPRVIKAGDEKRFLGFSLVETNETSTVLTKENVGSYLGKTVLVRSPMYCKASETDFCSVCVGPRLSDNPFAASTAITSIGDEVMGAFMALMHGAALVTNEYNLERELT